MTILNVLTPSEHEDIFALGLFLVLYFLFHFTDKKRARDKDRLRFLESEHVRLQSIIESQKDELIDLRDVNSNIGFKLMQAENKLDTERTKS